MIYKNTVQTVTSIFYTKFGYQQVCLLAESKNARNQYFFKIDDNIN